MRGALKEISVRTPQYTRNSVSVNAKIPYIRSEGLKAARSGTSPAKNATAFPSQLCCIKALSCPAVAIGRACRNMRRQGWAALRAIVCLTSRPLTLSAGPGTPWPPRFNTWVPALQEALDAPTVSWCCNHLATASTYDSRLPGPGLANSPRPSLHMSGREPGRDGQRNHAATMPPRLATAKKAWNPWKTARIEWMSSRELR